MNGWHEVLARGVYAAAIRGAVLAVVAIVARTYSAAEASTVAFGFGVAVLLNLASSFGLPTVLVRRLRALEGGDAGVALVLYLILNFAAGPVTVAVMVIAGEAAAISAAFGAFTVSAGFYTLGEYLALGLNQYGLLLRRFAPYHVVLALAAVAAAAFRPDVTYLVLGLASAHALPFAVLGVVRRRDLRRAMGITRFNPISGVIRDSAKVGVGSVFSALYGAVDVVVARPALQPGEFVTLRLVMLSVGAALAVVPIDFFVVAHSASGAETPRHEVVRAAIGCAILTLILAAALLYSADLNGLSLLPWAVLAASFGAFRMVTRVGIAQLNGRGAHTLAAALSVVVVVPAYLLSWFAVRRFGLWPFVGVLLMADMCYATGTLRFAARLSKPLVSPDQIVVPTRAGDR